VAHPDVSRPAAAQRLRDARRAWGWSQNDLAAQVEKVRTAHNLPACDRESLRRQIVQIEKTGKAGPLWRWLLAEALQADEDYLFGLQVDVALPRPLLLKMPVDLDVVDVLLAQRAAHIRAEHIFGPAHARDLVDRDLVTIESLITVTPAALRHDVRRAAGMIAEVGGWIAQDSGDYITAARLTIRAADHLRAAEPDLRAMILMRRSTIVVREDPELAVDLAAGAARLIEGQSVGRLAASITRQQALAALANHDHVAFREHAAHALDLADIDPVPEDHAVYASGAFVAAEIAAGYLSTGHAGKAAELLLAHDGRWPATQRCDFGVAATRLLRAFIAQGDYDGAAEQLPVAVPAYQAAPSDRARQELRICRKIVRDRARSTKSLPLHTLRTRINAVLQEDPTP
jgi:hypothetical protein